MGREAVPFPRAVVPGIMAGRAGSIFVLFVLHVPVPGTAALSAGGGSVTGRILAGPTVLFLTEVEEMSLFFLFFVPIVWEVSSGAV